MATRQSRTPNGSTKANGSPRATANGTGNGPTSNAEALKELLAALSAARDGDFSVRLPTQARGVMGQIAEAYNDVVEINARQAGEIARVGAGHRARGSHDGARFAR